MPKLSLEWPRGLNGYEVRYGRSSPSYLESDEPGKDPYIARLGEKIETYDCMKIAGLYERLACSPPNEKGALAFVKIHGFLKRKTSEKVRQICDAIREVAPLVRAKHKGDWAKLASWAKEKGDSIRVVPVLIDGSPPQLFYRPASLYDAIFLQFFEDLSTGASLKHCKRPGCPEWFKFGPGTSHRSTAEYCSAKCQNAHKYAKRKEGAV
jgi:hypothetical protein